MTKDEVLTVLNAVAEEFEGLDHDDLARAYRRAAALVRELEDGPRRRRRRTARATAPVSEAQTQRRRPGRPRRTQPAPE
jgi:hypothetical protein